MRRTIVLLSALLLALLLAGCTQSLVEPGASAPKAEEEFARIVNLAVQGAAAGDDAALEAYLAEGAYGGQLAALLEENGVTAEPEEAAAKGLLWFQPLPQFTNTSKYAGGDVLLSRSLCSLPSNQLAWLVLSQYTHCGVLNQQAALAWVGGGGLSPEAPCVLSATLNDAVSGVTYETWNDWSAATTVTALRAKTGVPVPGPATMDAVRAAFNHETASDYAFVVTDPAAGLVPVPGVPSPALGIPSTHSASWGPVSTAAYATPEGQALCAFYWYCSKTSWWAYKAAVPPAFGADIEYNYLIDVIDRAYGIQNSGFYQLYRLLFDADDATARAFCYFASDVCVWPDEIRWAGDGLPWLLTRYAPAGHAPPKLLTKQWTWGLPAY